MSRARLAALAGMAVAAAGVTGCGGSTAVHSTGRTHTARAATTAATSPGTTTSSGTATTASSDASGGCLVSSYPGECYSPQALRTAYDVTPLIDRSITGRGVTVVLPEEPDPSSMSQSAPTTDIHRDMVAYDARFGLPAPPSLRVVSAPAAGTASPSADGEEVLDAEMVHAIAPGASIVIDRHLGPMTGPVLAAAAKLGDVVSLSYGTGQTCPPSSVLSGQQSALRLAERRHVTVLASAGDSGAAARQCSPKTPALHRSVGVPSSNPLVTAVGGTSLRTDGPTGRYVSESVWNDNAASFPLGGHPKLGANLAASGGGFSSLYAAPSYQRGIHGIGSHRGVPDVSADADPRSGFGEVLVVDGHARVVPNGGTSAAAPLWAGIVALADQYAHRSLGFIDPALYRIGTSSQYHDAFHDVTSGSNTVTLVNGHTLTGYSATRGWDPVSGWGSPKASGLIPLLAKDA